jgi:hypothetical protein
MRHNRGGLLSGRPSEVLERMKLLSQEAYARGVDRKESTHANHPNHPWCAARIARTHSS